MPKGFKSVIESVNPEVIIDLGLDVVIARHNAAPTSGASGTLAGIAGPGSLIIVTAGSSSNLYLNQGSKASPSWKAASLAS